MKLVFVLALFLTTVFVNKGFAQPFKGKAKFSQRSVIKDSLGQVYEDDGWKMLLVTGMYKLVPENADDPQSAFKVIRLSEKKYKHNIENPPKPRESKSFITGKGIGSFIARDINGNKYKIKELTGKVVVINFWFIGCAPCLTEIPELNKVVEEYKDSSNVVFLAVGLDEKDRIETFLEQKPFLYNIIDNGRYISHKYSITSYPTNLVLDKNGKVLFHSAGYSAGVVPWIRKSIKKALE